MNINLKFYIMEKEFLNFLRKNRAIRAYKRYGNRSKCGLDDFLERQNHENYIEAAFIWEITFNGWDYWYKLNQKWLKYLDKLENK